MSKRPTLNEGENSEACAFNPTKSVPTLEGVVPGQAGGGSFRGERSYRPKKEFAYRIGAGPTKNYQVLHLSNTPCYKVLLSTTT